MDEKILELERLTNDVQSALCYLSDLIESYKSSKSICSEEFNHEKIIEHLDFAFSDLKNYLKKVDKLVYKHV